MDDLVDAAPFEGVANRVSALFLEKGRQTIYPVEYRKWQLQGKYKSIPESLEWHQVRKHILINNYQGMPTDPNRPTSHWMTGSADALAFLSRLSGKCPYQARTGIFTGGANGIFYLELIERLSNGNLRVRNITERAKRKVETVEAELEPTYVFPLLRGRDVTTWHYSITGYILCPHTIETKMHAVKPTVLKTNAPLTYAYLEKFKHNLGERRGFGGWELQFLKEAFYAIQRIGIYTFAPYKVIWRYISKAFTCCVVEPQNQKLNSPVPIMPHEKLMLIGLDNQAEAYYICGFLSSSPIRFFIESQMVETQIAPHIISKLLIPEFDNQNPLHIRISELCKEGHISRNTDNGLDYYKYINIIDTIIFDVLGIPKNEATIIKQFLNMDQDVS